MPVDYRARLSAKSAATVDSDAILTTGRLDDILAEFALPDLDARQPSDPAWIPTYNMSGAIAAAWREKAGMLFAAFKAAPASGLTFDLQQRYEHALQMAHEYEGAGGLKSLEVATDPGPRQLLEWTGG